MLEFLDQFDRGGRAAAVVGGGTGSSEVAALRSQPAWRLSHNQR